MQNFAISLFVRVKKMGSVKGRVEDLIQLGQQNEFSKIIYYRTFQKMSLPQMDSGALLAARA